MGFRVKVDVKGEKRLIFAMRGSMDVAQYTNH
jgi:hypothetical protein